MTKYFDQFPIIDYNLTGVNGNTTEVTDIFRRVKARSKIADNVTLFDKYDVAEGEKPEELERQKEYVEGVNLQGQELHIGKLCDILIGRIRNVECTGYWAGKRP